MSETIDTTTGEILEEGRRFNPSRYLRKLDKGGDYLDVKWRIRWVRDVHPDAVMTSTIVELNWEQGYIVVHAHVEIPGRGVADGIGSETRANFPAGWVEKAETVAYGRALAALGFGTQFCFDFDTIDEAGNGKLADSPVGGSGSFGSHGQQGGNPGLASGAQLNLIYLTATRDLDITEEELEAHCGDLYGGRLPLHLTKREASEFIDQLKARAAGEDPKPVPPKPAPPRPEPPKPEPPKPETPKADPPPGPGLSVDLYEWARGWVRVAMAGEAVQLKGKNARTEELKAMMAHLQGLGVPAAQIGPLCERLHELAGGEAPSEIAPVSVLIDPRLILALKAADSGAGLMLKRYAAQVASTPF